MKRTTTILGVLAACGLALSASAQTPAETKPAQPEAKPASPAPTPTPVPTPAAQPTLDDLLGITKPKPAEPTTPPATPPATEGNAQPGPWQPVDPTRADLERKLNDPNVAEDFVQAVTLMKETSDRLTRASDVGLETQRLQQEVLLRLDKLIDEAKNQSKSKKSKSKSSSKQEQDQQQNQEQEQSSQQSKPQQGNQQAAGSAQGGNVPRQNAQLKAAPAGASASWGDLPPHVRDALMQGFSDSFSPTYEQMTQEYYKRLAEQKPSGVAPPTPNPPVPAPAPVPNPGGGN
ncbi:MAG TPA: hypothetical protein VHN77_15915 [Phycisphaerales bacterium]|nr:hypothetical protein [Phycisphaerales bacterium]